MAFVDGGRMDRVYRNPPPRRDDAFSDVRKQMHGISVDMMMEKYNALSPREISAANVEYDRLVDSREDRRNLGMDNTYLDEGPGMVLLLYAGHLIAKSKEPASLSKIARIPLILNKG